MPLGSGTGQSPEAAIDRPFRAFNSPHHLKGKSMKTKLMLSFISVSVLAIASAQANSVAIKDMTLVQESGAVAPIGHMGHHHGHHGHHGFHGFHGHHGVRAKAPSSSLPAPRVNN
jgi:hypothetical protein